MGVAVGVVGWRGVCTLTAEQLHSDYAHLGSSPACTFAVLWGPCAFSICVLFHFGHFRESPFPSFFCGVSSIL